MQVPEKVTQTHDRGSMQPHPGSLLCALHIEAQHKTPRLSLHVTTSGLAGLVSASGYVLAQPAVSHLSSAEPAQDPAT